MDHAFKKPGVQNPTFWLHPLDKSGKKGTERGEKHDFCASGFRMDPQEKEFGEENFWSFSLIENKCHTYDIKGLKKPSHTAKRNNSKVLTVPEKTLQKLRDTIFLLI